MELMLGCTIVMEDEEMDYL